MVEQIKARLPLEDVISETVDLRPAGRNQLKGLCPFHDDKTPSFNVSTDQGLYYCFSCQAKGDLFTFVQKTRNLEFRPALEHLAQRAGVELESSERGARKRNLHELNELAQEYFVRQLAAHSGAQSYLKGRGLTPETIARWGLGYAPEGGQELIKYARTKGIEPAALERAGLAGNKDGRHYAFFRNRVTIPIRNQFGQIVGFSARTLGGDQPKYLNTRETEIFKKGDLLFGLDFARDTIREKSAAILVEGQLDVIALHQAGRTTAVGLQASTLTPTQIATLERLGVKELSLSLDPDEAGQKATLSTLNAIQRRFGARVVRLDGKDPAEMLRTDPDGFRAALEEAQTEAEWRYTTALQGLDMSTRRDRDLFLEQLKPALGDMGKPGSGAELRSLAAAAVGADVTTAELKTFAEGKELTIDAHREAEEDTAWRKQLVRDKVAGEVQAFPLQVLPAPLRAYVEVCATALPVPPDFIAVPMLAALATAIGHSREIVVKRSWREGARLFAAIVGDPGSRKSAALDKANDPLYEHQKTFKREHDDALEVYRSQVQDYDNAKARRKKGEDAPEHPGDEPRMKQVMLTDATLEALMELHTKNERALLLCQDELSGWVSGMDQYKSGKGNDKQKWLSIWSGGQIIVNRKGKQAEMIAEPYISVSGGIQPDILPTLQTAQGADGFIDRILFSYPKAVESKGFSFDDDVDDEHVAGYRKVISRLWGLEQVDTVDGPQPKPLQMTDDAKAVFAEWIDEHTLKRDVPGLDRKLRGAWGKMDGYFARFALILHLAALASGEETSETISKRSVIKAAALTQYFKSHAARVYQQLGNGPEDKSLNAIYTYIDHQPKRRCTPRELYRAKVSGCTNTKTTTAQLQKLAEAGLGALEEVKTASGQKSLMFVLSEKAEQGVG
jgi:DNA primase catalytic core